MGAVVRAAAAKLEPQFRDSGEKCGYACAQVSPARAGDREAMMEMAHRFHAWAPNIAVKLPVTYAGLDVLEECAAEAITVTATVSFTVPQVIAVAERYRRGVARARQAGLSPRPCFAVIMIGRLDDYLREVAWDQRLGLGEADLRQAGLAVTKRAYAIYQERGYEAVLLVAALRGTHHMTGLAGANLIMSIHPRYQGLLLEPGVPREPGIHLPVDPGALQRLCCLPEFKRAYEPEGMLPEEFITYGVTQKTLAQFEASWATLEAADWP
jgi:transaldolase